jgi:hypothetical protein
VVVLSLAKAAQSLEAIRDKLAAARLDGICLSAMTQPTCTANGLAFQSGLLRWGE